MDALGRALLDSRDSVRCSDPACHADWQLSLHHTVAHFSHKAPALHLRSEVVPTHRAADMRASGQSLFVLGPSVLGTFYGVGQCHRYLHVRTERRFLSSMAAAQDGTGGAVSSVIAAVSVDAATLDKGHLWEEALNKQLEGKPLPAALLRDGGSWGGAGACSLRDMTRETPAGTACTCAAGSRQPGESMWEVRHVAVNGSLCAYTTALLKVSLDFLHTAPPGTCIYQPKFELPAALATRSIDPSVIAFSFWQPDYLFVRLGRGGGREVVVVDAKASGGVKESHKVQVAFYCFALRHMLANPQERGRDAFRAAPGGSTVASFGAVWLPDAAEPETFPITDLEDRMLRLLRDTIPKLLTEKAFNTALEGRKPDGGSLCQGQKWQLKHHCRACEYVAECKKEAVSQTPQLVRSLPGITEAAEKALLKLPDLEDCVPSMSLPRLAEWLRPQRPGLKEALDQATATRATTPQHRVLTTMLGVPLAANGRNLDSSGAENGPSVSPKVASWLAKRPVARRGALSLTLPRLGAEPYWAIFVTLLTEPIGGHLYGWGVQAVEVGRSQNAIGAQALAPVVGVTATSSFTGRDIKEVAIPAGSTLPAGRPLHTALVTAMYDVLHAQALRGARTYLRHRQLQLAQHARAQQLHL